MSTLYEKRGRRYFAVAEHESFAAVPLGWWLVHVQPGIRSSRRVDPDRAAVEAAMRIAEDAMVEAMQRENQRTDPSPKPSPAKMERHRKAWAAYCAVFGKNPPVTFMGASMHGVVDAGIAALRSAMAKSAGPAPEGQEG